jgi:hypothetical protein
MGDFVKDQCYDFVGSILLVEDRVKNDANIDPNVQGAVVPVYLGKFIEYRGYVCAGDWLHDAKARFEFGTISSGRYYKVQRRI